MESRYLRCSGQQSAQDYPYQLRLLTENPSVNFCESRPPHLALPLNATAVAVVYALRKTVFIMTLVNAVILRTLVNSETHRTFNRRRNEHGTQDQSKVYQHFKNRHPRKDILPNLTTTTIASGFENTNNRQAFESNCIRKGNPNINIQHSNG